MGSLFETFKLGVYVNLIRSLESLDYKPKVVNDIVFILDDTVSLRFVNQINQVILEVADITNNETYEIVVDIVTCSLPCKPEGSLLTHHVSSMLEKITKERELIVTELIEKIADTYSLYKDTEGQYSDMQQTLFIKYKENNPEFEFGIKDRRGFTNYTVFNITKMREETILNVISLLIELLSE